MNQTTIIMVVAFLGTISLFGVIGLIFTGRKGKEIDRIDALMGKQVDALDQAGADIMKQAVQNALPKLGKALVEEGSEEQSRLKGRLTQAGLYSQQSLLIFLGVKLLLMVIPVVIGLILGLVGVVPLQYGLVGGGLASVGGMIGPSFWLDRRKSSRQATLRRSLPDALDLIIICVDGGLSLPGALRRVVVELAVPHPMLSAELNIVQREIQLGQTSSEALKSFARRCDIEEVRSLAATVQNAERFGASMVKSLRVFADALRQKRQQKAEEMAQKAGTKTLFPTLLFIFPSIFVIILGPAAMRIVDLLGKMGN